MTRTAWLAGASGLIGGELLRLLLADASYSSVVSLGRRPLDTTHEKLVQRQVDFASLSVSELRSPDVAFCTLGTTIAKAGSQAAFRAVDHDAVLAFARAAQSAGARAFVVVTALGASAESSVFYNRVKGETEAALRALDFPLLAIAQPSLLLGERAEARFGESLAISASRLLSGVLKPFAWRPIEASVVARALVAIARTPPSGTTLYPSGVLQTLGKPAP